jgi:hypothetical protein
VGRSAAFGQEKIGWRAGFNGKSPRAIFAKTIFSKRKSAGGCKAFVKFFTSDFRSGPLPGSPQVRERKILPDSASDYAFFSRK